MHEMMMQVLYAVENLLCMRGILQVEFTKKKERLAAAGSLFAGVLVFQGIVGFGMHVAPVFMGLKIVLAPMIFAGAAGVSILKLLLCFFGTGVLMDPVETLLFIIGRHLGFYWPKEKWLFLYDLAFIGVLAVITWLIGNHETWKAKISNISIHYYVIGVLLNLSAGIVGYVVKSTELDMTLAMKDLMDILCTLLIELIYLVWLFLIILDDLRRKYQKESQLKSRYLEMAKGHYQSLEAHVTEVRKIRHDMRHHFMVIGVYLQQGKTEEAYHYLEQEGVRLEKLTVFPFDTGNHLVNAVIAYEKGKMPDGLTFHCEGKLPKELEMADYDLCCIFANLFSNAREACEQLRTKEKEIYLRLKQTDGKLVLLVENPVEWEIDAKALIPHTTKENISEHGYGLLNVKEAVEAYGGEFEICAEEGMFRVMIII